MTQKIYIWQPFTLYHQFSVFHILEVFLKIPLREKLQSDLWIAGTYAFGGPNTFWITHQKNRWGGWPKNKVITKFYLIFFKNKSSAGRFPPLIWWIRNRFGTWVWCSQSSEQFSATHSVIRQRLNDSRKFFKPIFLFENSTKISNIGK